MSGTKILGVILVLAGLLGLVYGHFDYTKETHQGQIGPFNFLDRRKRRRSFRVRAMLRWSSRCRITRRFSASSRSLFPDLPVVQIRC